MADPGAGTPAADGQGSWESALLPLNLSSITIAWAKLHIQKHAAESILQEKGFIVNIFAPLLTTVLPHARKSWRAVDKKVRAALDATRAARAASAAQAALAATPQVGADAAAEDDELGDDEVELEARRECNDAALDVLNLGGAADESDEDDEGGHAERAIENLGEEVQRQHFYYKRELDDLEPDELRAQLELRGKATQGTKADLVERLWVMVQEEEKVEEGGDQSVKMNLHRLKQLLLHLMLRWDGKTLGWKGGASVRSLIVEQLEDDADLQAAFYASCARRSVVGVAWSGEVAVAAACDRSSFFANFWRFFEVEVRLATVPYQSWVEGDLLRFLEALPSITLQVCAAPKPLIRKYMLLNMERLLHYKDKHPDVLKFISRNCKRLDEEDVELTNALLGRFCHARQVADIDTYIHVSGLLGGLHQLTAELDARAFNRKPQASEHVRLRDLYSTPSWKESNAVLDNWILDTALRAAAGDAQLDAAWERDDRFKRALDNMPIWEGQLESWLKTKRRREAAPGPGPAPAPG